MTVLLQARAVADRWELDVGVLVRIAIDNMVKEDGSLRFGVALFDDGDIGIQVPLLSWISRCVCFAWYCLVLRLRLRLLLPCLRGLRFIVWSSSLTRGSPSRSILLLQNLLWT